MGIYSGGGGVILGAMQKYTYKVSAYFKPFLLAQKS